MPWTKPGLYWSKTLFERPERRGRGTEWFWAPMLDGTLDSVLVETWYEPFDGNESPRLVQVAYQGYARKIAAAEQYTGRVRAGRSVPFFDAPGFWWSLVLDRNERTLWMAELEDPHIPYGEAPFGEVYPLPSWAEAREWISSQSETLDPFSGGTIPFRVRYRPSFMEER